MMRKSRLWVCAFFYALNEYGYGSFPRKDSKYFELL